MIYKFVLLFLNTICLFTLDSMRSFTLVELLIVVTIIGLLAAIAIPNFLNARMRAMVVRTIADLKNCATAIEQYAIDRGKYPYYNNMLDEVSAISGAAVTYLPISLTTPISYIAQIPIDPFPPAYLAGIDLDSSQKPYKYIHGYDQVYKNQQFVGAHIGIHFENYSGVKRNLLWQSWSLGPDRIVAHDGVSYDLSNGLFSYGDISRFGP